MDIAQHFGSSQKPPHQGWFPTAYIVLFVLVVAMALLSAAVML